MNIHFLKLFLVVSVVFFVGSTMVTDAAHMSRGEKMWKIHNAMSAAPSKISRNATVVEISSAGSMQVLRKGSNKWTCMPDDPNTPGNDPLCADETAVQWFTAYLSHKKPIITRPGIAYMLQGGSEASNTDPYAMKPAKGDNWMASPPHIMIFPSGKLDKNVYGTDMHSGHPWIMWDDTPYEHLMIPVM